METNNKNTQTTEQQTRSPYKNANRTGRALGGLLIVVIGILLLARQAGADIPRWVFSFEVILILVGLYIGLRHSFRGFAWLIPLLIGVFFLLDDFYPAFDFRDFIWPVLVISIGLFIMLRSLKTNPQRKGYDPVLVDAEESADDVIDSTVIFGGSKKNVISKNFRGGEAVTVFGGTELNLMQAELPGPVVLELTQVFGGTKLIVPAHWKVQSREMVAILGGIDDKRPVLGNADRDDNQVLILRGTCILGGIEVRSY